MDYGSFLHAKIQMAPEGGFAVSEDEINPILKPHQRAMVVWACAGGRRAIFAAFGLGKSVIQLEILRLVLKRFGGKALLVMPLGVRQEFRRDAAMLGLQITFIRSVLEASADGLYMTNYETVRDGKIDPHFFTATSLDEASCLRGFGGSKTFREFMRLFDGVKFKFVATATPSPNEYIELLAYSAFLEVMDVGQAKTRFFKRNSEKADTLTIHPHKQREFWLWVASWGLFVERPSDLGFSDEGYDLPEMVVNWHELPADHASAGSERNGQGRLLRDVAASLVETAREKRDSLPARVAKMMELRAENPDAHRLIWHDLEAERHAIEHAIADVRTVYGTQELDEREQTIIDFSEGRIRELAGKASIMGSGCNFQRFCSWAIFLGIGFKFNDFIQAVHRIQRFLQTSTVRIDLIYTEAERPVRESLQAKWRRHIEQRAEMTAIIKEFGLSAAAMAATLSRAMGVERIEVTGEGYRVVNNDCVVECKSMIENSVDLIVTSIPFSTQYEYSPNYADFGHTDDNGHFWEQMDFLIPELYRVLAPGRIAAIHVKDRIVPGGMTGLGFQTVYPFADDCTAHFRKHGFAFLSRKTITTDVVRENNQTYRLGWSEQCKDGSRMGNGLPEYLLIFRKPPSDSSNGYADKPVGKRKREWAGAGPNTGWNNTDGYSRGRWQLDAHGYEPSSGNRLLQPDELLGLEASQIFKIWKSFSLEAVYEFEHHVKVAEVLEERGMLPSTFMLLPPHSKHDDVWTDITRMLSMNTLQAAKGKELHLCPLQFDIVDRAIQQYSEPGETVFDPFGGLMTVPYRALKLGRRGEGVELNPAYFFDGCKYVEAIAKEKAMPSLFDIMEAAE
ncbi:DNA methyltransferase [Rhizobium sp. Root1203]|uniref:DNA methyltransferase n=1 Tax=Rhizobium sp. Root1203 TaxID=1736427 RepID=UPI000AEC7425|nr:DNA methyltransferase [Rhizobium sp. Root1203]